MDTPQLQSQIKELQSQVSPYSKKKSNLVEFSFQGALTSSKIYLVIPGIVLILLLIIRPGFLYITQQNKKSLSVQKILVAWLIISFLLIIGLFGYNYKINH